MTANVIPSKKVAVIYPWQVLPVFADPPVDQGLGRPGSH